MSVREYNARLRPWRIGYAAAIAVVVIAVGVIVKIAYNHGEISHATLRTAARPAPDVPLSTTSATLSTAWTSADHTAIGTPYWRGTVVTYSQHAVTGRNGLTGKAMWSYTRNDRTTCTAAQLGGVTIAVFEVNGNCDELTALDTQTGARQWVRTLDKDGHELNGHPSYAVGQFTFMVWTPQVIYALSPDGTANDGNGGLDRWVFAQEGCTINSAVLGSSGALISQTCRKPDCGERQFCGAGQQLLLRDATAGDNHDDAKNPDKIKWNLIGSTLLPASADGVISAVHPGGTALTVLDQQKGTTVSTLPLQAPAREHPQAIAAARAQLVSTGGYTYAVGLSGTSVLWSAQTANPPAVTSREDATTPDLSHAIVATVSGGAINLLDGVTGTVQRTLAVGTASGGTAYAFGTGFVVAGDRTAVYR